MLSCPGTKMFAVQWNGNLIKATVTLLIKDNKMKYLGIFLNVKVMKTWRFSLDSPYIFHKCNKRTQIEPTYGTILFCKHYKNLFSSLGLLAMSQEW